RQYAGCQLHDTGQLLPYPAPADGAQFPQTPDPDDAQEPAAPQTRRVGPRRNGAGFLLPSPFVGRCRSAGRSKTEIRLVADEQIRRVVLCTGKVYYDLLEDREKKGINDVYL